MKIDVKELEKRLIAFESEIPPRKMTAEEKKRHRFFKRLVKECEPELSKLSPSERETRESNISLYCAFYDGQQSKRWDGSVYISEGMCVTRNGLIVKE